MSAGAENESRGHSGSHGRKKLLISDPEPFIRDTLRIKFASKGYHVILADTGRETVRMVARHEPALVLLEIDFKDLDGYRVCQLLKGNEKTEHVPIVALTRLEATPERTFLFSPYVSAFMVKPFSPREVAKVVNKIIKEQSAE